MLVTEGVYWIRYIPHILGVQTLTRLANGDIHCQGLIILDEAYRAAPSSRPSSILAVVRLNGTSLQLAERQLQREFSNVFV